MSGQEKVLQNVNVQLELSPMTTKVNTNVNIVITNVTLVKKKPKPVNFVPVTELMLLTVTVHQVTSTNQIMPCVPDVPKNVKPVPTVDPVPLVTLQDSTLHTVTAQPVNSKSVDLPPISNVTLLVLIHNVTIVPINVTLVKDLLKVLVNVLVTESKKPIVVAQVDISIPSKKSVQNVTPVVKLVNSPNIVV